MSSNQQVHISPGPSRLTPTDRTFHHCLMQLLVLMSHGGYQECPSALHSLPRLDPTLMTCWSRMKGSRQLPGTDSPSGPSQAHCGAAQGVLSIAHSACSAGLQSRGDGRACAVETAYIWGGTAEPNVRGLDFFMLYPAALTNLRSPWAHRKLPESVRN